MAYLAGGIDLYNAGGTIEKYSATGDGVRTSFSAAEIVPSGFSYYNGLNALQVFIDGVYQEQSAWSETGTTSITFSAPVPSGSTIEIRKMESAKVSSGPTINDYTYTSDGTLTVLSAAELSPAGFLYTMGTRTVEVYFDGVRQNDYTETSQTSLTFPSIPNGVSVVVRVQGAIKLIDAIPSDGGTMVADPVTPLGVATKQYVDGLDNSARTYVDGQLFGVGQTWQDLTLSRTEGVTYTNTTGRSIFVSISTNGTAGGNAGATILVDDLAVLTGLISTGGGAPLTVVVPNGSTYRQSVGTIFKWFELR